MTTITIDIPDDNTEEVLAQLKKLGVEVRESNLSKLGELTKDAYEKHFKKRAELTRNQGLKYL